MKAAWASIIAIMAASSSLSCAATLKALAEAGQPKYGNRYKLTIVSASIATARPDGRPWHVEPPDASIPFLVGLAGMTFGIPPAIAVQAGELLAGDTQYPPPSPQVRLQIGGTLLETFPVKRNFNPTWEYSFAIDIRDYQPDTAVVVLVLDAEGGEVIGEKSTQLSEFLASNSVTIAQAGSVKALQIKIDALPDVPECVLRPMATTKIQSIATT